MQCSQPKSSSMTWSKRLRDRRSCSQIRTTTKFWRLSSLVIFRARCTFELIFLVQYSRFELGSGLLHFRHPCQKQPSMKTTRLLSRNTKSGEPVSVVSCKFHPRIRLRIRADRNFHSVERLPLERTLRIRSLRSDLLRKSITTFRFNYCTGHEENLHYAKAL